MFVHVRKDGTPQQDGNTIPLAVTSQHVNPAEAADPNPTVEPEPAGNSIKPAVPVVSPTPQVTTCVLNCGPQIQVKDVVTPVLNAVVGPICNELQKSDLLNAYNQKVDTENNRYQEAVNASSQLLGDLLAPVTDTVDALLPEHQQILSQLQDDLSSGLAAINCNL
jgi:hypothetical protein